MLQNFTRQKFLMQKMTIVGKICPKKFFRRLRRLCVTNFFQGQGLHYVGVAISQGMVSLVPPSVSSLGYIGVSSEIFWVLQS